MKIFCLLDFSTSLTKLHLYSHTVEVRLLKQLGQTNHIVFWEGCQFLSSFCYFLPFILFTILDMLRVQAHFPSRLQAVVGLQRWPKHIRL